MMALTNYTGFVWVNNAALITSLSFGKWHSAHLFVVLVVDFQPHRTRATGSVFQRVLVSAEIFFIAQNTQNFAIYAK